MLGSVYSRPGLELAAAASNGAGDGSTVARPGQEGGAPLYGRPGSPSATTRPSAASLGARAGLGRSEPQGNDVGPGKALQYGGATRGAAFEASWGAGGLGNTRPRAARGGGSDGEVGGRLGRAWRAPARRSLPEDFRQALFE
jgi:hypothetical protein